MLDYEDIKELSAAGYQFEKAITTTPLDMVFTYPTEGGLFHWIQPTLSKLIEACNVFKADEFGLVVDIDQWEVYYTYHGYFEHNESFKDEDGLFNVELKVNGQTPEQAVAKLWIALNKK